MILAVMALLLVQEPKPYRLESVDLKQRIIWSETCDELSFGGQDQDAPDGRPHTRLGGKPIHEQLRASNPFQKLHDEIWSLRSAVRDLLARARHLYFEARKADEDTKTRRVACERRLKELVDTPGLNETRRGTFALEHLRAAMNLPEGNDPAALKALWAAQVHLELAAEVLDAEPPARALRCGRPRRKGVPPTETKAIVHDARTGLYVLFGGDHLDYLTNDTWVFDPKKPRWERRFPEGAPPPRANHLMEAPGDGTVKLRGGYTYSSSTGYISGQYRDLEDDVWVYDIAKNTWSGGALVPSDSRTYRTGPFHPEFFLQGDPPDAEGFAEWLGKLPKNVWTATDPPFRPRLNRDWGCARIDPDRDLLLRWSGGHSAHGGTDVPHFHFATNRWELPFPVEFPLGQLYSNTSYPNGVNFNRRPWMTGHTYQNWAYDPPTRRMVKTGRPRHFHIYDPDIGDWIGRGPKPQAMRYNSCFYTLTLTSTPGGALCWGRNGKVHRFEGGRWVEWELSGDPLPGAYVDNSCIAYDGRRDRALIINTAGYRVPYDGRIWALDLKTRRVQELKPKEGEHARRFAYVDRSVYDPENDLLLVASYLKESGERTRTPAYDCASNRWITLDLDYGLGKRVGRLARLFPHGRSCGIVHDPKRKLIWGTDTNSQIYVLRLDRKTADEQPLGR